MRLLKKYIRKLYHLIWFLGAFLIFTPSVFAIQGNPNLNGVEFYTPIAATFLDNTNQRLTTLTTSWNNTAKYFSADIQLNGANTAGANLNFTAITPVYFGYTYILTVVLGSNGLLKTSDGRVCIAENLSNNIYRWEHSFSEDPNWCVNTIYTDYFAGVGFNIANSDYSNVINNYTILYYVFTANKTDKSIMVDFQSQNSQYSTTIFGGYKLDLISDNNSISQAQIQQAIQNSGLATANSVAQVQRGVNEIKQELSGVQDSINDVNDTLNDSSVDSSDNTINNLKNQIPTNSVISDLLLLPVRFLQNFVNALGSSCSRFSLGSLYGTELFMPCINIENYLGSGIWTTIDLIISGLFVYSLRKKFIEIYENLTNLKNGGNEVD